jgi:hypothetical protein
MLLLLLLLKKASFVKCLVAGINDIFAFNKNTLSDTVRLQSLGGSKIFPLPCHVKPKVLGLRFFARPRSVPGMIHSSIQ